MISLYGIFKTYSPFHLLKCFYHPSKELTADARELKGELYCLPCHDKMGVPICGACRRPIEGRGKTPYCTSVSCFG